jgi:hypothetical protein
MIHEIRYYGYTHPPHAVIEIIRNIKFNTELVFYILDPLTKQDPVPFDKIRSSDPARTFVVLFTGEGHGYPEFHQICDQIIANGLPAEHIIIYTGCLQDSGPCTNIGTVVPHLTATLNQSDQGHQLVMSPPTHHFVCLNRAPAWQRAQLVERLLDRSLARYGRISYGVFDGFDSTNLGKNPIDPIVYPMRYRDRLPLVVDSSKVSVDDGFSTVDPAISGAMINLAAETGYEPHPKMPQHMRNIQNVTLSEKTYKIFLMGQMPLILGVPDTVSWIRRLGFDVFDDIINHSYDQEPDPGRRIDLVVAELLRFCNKYQTVESLVSLHEFIGPRLLLNYRLLKRWRSNHSLDRPRWLKFFAGKDLVSYEDD